MRMPPHEIMVRTLTEVEARFEETTPWGSPPVLLQFTAPGPHEIEVHAVDFDFEQDVSQDLWRFAMSLTFDDDSQEARRELVESYTIGWAMVQETLSNLDISMVNQAMGVPIAEHPATKRTRVCFGVDILARTMSVVRQEGMSRASSDPRPIAGGRIVQGLRLLNMCVARHLTEGQPLLDRLHTMKVPNTDELDRLALNQPGGLVYIEDRKP